MKKKELGLERLREEYHRFRNEISSIRSPSCSQTARSSISHDSEDEDSEKNRVWDSVEGFKQQQEQQDISKADLVEEWNCTPRSHLSTSSGAAAAAAAAGHRNVEIGECSAGPKVRITATTLFTANRGQVFIDECNNTEHADAEAMPKLASEVPRVTSPPSKSPRDPTPRSDATGAVHLPAGEMVLASSSMNIHIGDVGISSPDSHFGKFSPAKQREAMHKRFVKPAASKRLRTKVKDILEKLDTGQPVNSLVLGSTLIEAGASEAQAYLQDVVSALSSRSRDDSVQAAQIFSQNREKVSGVEPVFQAVQVEADVGSCHATESNQGVQCCLEIEEPCTDDKLVQCYLPSENAFRAQDMHLLAKETQCSDLGIRLEKIVTEHPGTKFKKDYGKRKDKGKTKAEPGDDYGKTLIARRANQNDEFLQRCREKVGNLLQGCRALEEAAHNPERVFIPFETGESSSRPKDTEKAKESLQTTKESKNLPVGNAANVVPDVSVVKHSAHKKPKAKPGVLKGANGSHRPNARPVAELSNEEELDYDQIYEELGNLITERAQIEEFDRVQREHLSIPYYELDRRQELVPEVKSGEEDLKGAKRSRTTRSPAREPGNKLLRLNMGKIQPLLKGVETKQSNNNKPLKRYDRLPAFKERDRKQLPRTSKFAISAANPDKENLKTEKLPAWVRRMTQNKPRFGIFEPVEKEEPDKLSLSGTVKRRNVRPPESIFKAGKHINWLSSPSIKNRPGDGSRRKLKKRGDKLVNQYQTHSGGDPKVQKGQHSDDSQLSDISLVDHYQAFKTDSTKQDQQRERVPLKPYRFPFKDVLEKRKQDWVVVGDFCISELERRSAYLDTGGNKQAPGLHSTKEVAMPSKEAPTTSRENKEVPVVADGIGRYKEAPPPVVTTSRGKNEVPVVADVVRGKKKAPAAAVIRETVAAIPDARGKTAGSDQMTIAGPSTAPSTIICLQETDSCRKSLDEELYKQSLLEVLLKNLLEEGQQPRLIENESPGSFEEHFLEQYDPTIVLDDHPLPQPARDAVWEAPQDHQTCFSGSGSQQPSGGSGFIISDTLNQALPSFSSSSKFPGRPPRHVVVPSSRPPLPTVQTQEPGAVQHIASISRPDIKLTIDIVERSVPPREDSEEASAAADEEARPSRLAPQQARSKPTALTRTFAFREDQAPSRPPASPRTLPFREEERVQDSSEDFESATIRQETRPQRSVGIQMSEVSNDRPSISVLPVVFPIMFPIQLAQQQQRPPEASSAAFPGESSTAPLLVRVQGKHIQTSDESSSSSPTTPSTPVSCSDREAVIQAALAPIPIKPKAKQLLSGSRYPLIITGMSKSCDPSPREKTSPRFKFVFPATSSDTGMVEAIGRKLPEDLPAQQRYMEGSDREMVQDIGKRELMSPKSVRSSINVEKMESLIQEQDMPSTSRTAQRSSDRELVQDIERRELMSPKIDRSSLHVDQMEPWEDLPSPSKSAIRSSLDSLLASSGEGVLAASYERTTVQSGSPTGSAVVEETHLLSRGKFRYEEEDMVRMSREMEETDVRTSMDIEQLESSRPSSPISTAVDKPSTSATKPPPKTPFAPTVARKEKLPPEFIDVANKGKKQLDSTTMYDETLRLSPRAEASSETKPQHGLVNALHSPTKSTLRIFGETGRKPREHKELLQEEQRSDDNTYLQFDYAAREAATGNGFASPRLLPSSKLKIHLERPPRGKFPMLFGRSVLPSREMKILAELERKAAAALRGKAFRNTPSESRVLGRDRQQFSLHYSGSFSVSSSSSDTSSSTRSRSGSDGSLHQYVRPSQLSEGEVDPGQIFSYGYVHCGDETPEEGEAPSLGEIR